LEETEMVQDIVGSKMKTFPSSTPQVKQPRPGQKFYRGIFIPQRDDARPNTGYGQGGNAMPSSLDSVPASDRLSDVPANNPDAVRDALVAGKPVVDDQTREVSDKLQPVSFAQKRQTTPSKVGDVVVGTLPATSGASAANPARKPGS
jgi:hypothetical protein